MTLDEAKRAIDKCSQAERKLLLTLTPHEVALALEAKLYADATITDGPKEVYGVIAPRKHSP